MIKRLEFNEGFKHVAISIFLLETEIKAWCKKTNEKRALGKLQTALCVINKGQLILTYIKNGLSTSVKKRMRETPHLGPELAYL